MQFSSNLRSELKPLIVIGFGSVFTGHKRGLISKKDIDLIIVSNYFRDMSIESRKQFIAREFGKRIDVVPLTYNEYGKLKTIRESIVTVALREGTVLIDE